MSFFSTALSLPFDIAVFHIFPIVYPLFCRFQPTTCVMLSTSILFVNISTTPNFHYDQYSSTVLPPAFLPNLFYYNIPFSLAEAYLPLDYETAKYQPSINHVKLSILHNFTPILMVYRQEVWYTFSRRKTRCTGREMKQAPGDIGHKQFSYDRPDVTLHWRNGTMVKKNSICIFVSAVMMLFLPWCSVTFIKGDNAMAVCFLLFYAINPVTAVAIGICSGCRIGTLWFQPILLAVFFLLGTWIFFDMGERAFLLYAAVYLLLGCTVMLSTSFLVRKRAG